MVLDCWVDMLTLEGDMLVLVILYADDGCVDVIFDSVALPNELVDDPDEDPWPSNEYHPLFCIYGNQPF